MRLYITSAAGISIVAPDTTNIVGPFEYDEAFDTLLLQPDGSAYSAKAATHNCDLKILHIRDEYRALQNPPTSDVRWFCYRNGSDRCSTKKRPAFERASL